MLLQCFHKQCWQFSGLALTAAVEVHIKFCTDCHRNVPSQPNAPPYPIQTPEYPFRCFQLSRCSVPCRLDQYSNWPIIKRKHNGSTGLIDCLCRLFATYGIPGKLASDSEPEFTTGTTSTCRIGESAIVYLLLLSHTQTAKLAVKTARWLITSNTWPYDSFDTYAIQQFFFMSQYPWPPNRTLGCIVSLDNLLKTSSQYSPADRNLVLPGLTHSTKRRSSEKPSYANYLRMVPSH